MLGIQRCTSGGGGVELGEKRRSEEDRMKVQDAGEGRRRIHFPLVFILNRGCHTRPFCVGVLLSSLHHFLVPMLALYGRHLASNEFMGTLPAELGLLTRLTQL